MSVEVRLAAVEEAPIVANLMSLYLFEYSATQQRAIGDDGSFHYASLEAYWTESGCYPFLIRADGHLAGFALVAERRVFEPEQEGHVIAEFFVLPTHRRKGVGAMAATELFDRFPGAWWVGQATWNESAQSFWRSAIGRYTHGEYQEEAWRWKDEEGIAQTFRSVPSV
jgi:predicted acetyltransferase